MEFVVQEATSGRGDRVKAYSIGVDVFGRGEGFDPNVDPIVRIEATRLRSALAAYYRGPGRDEPVKIMMRPGTYSPVFAGLTGGVVGMADALHSNPAIIVAGHATDPRNERAFACGSILVKMLARRLIEDQHRVFFMGANGRRGRAGEQARRQICVGAHYGLEISVLPFAGGRRYVWTVSDQDTGEVCGIGDADEIGDGLPEALSISELASKAFCSITTILARTARH